TPPTGCAYRSAGRGGPGGPGGGGGPRGLRGAGGALRRRGTPRGAGGVGEPRRRGRRRAGRHAVGAREARPVRPAASVWSLAIAHRRQRRDRSPPPPHGAARGAPRRGAHGRRPPARHDRGAAPAARAARGLEGGRMKEPLPFDHRPDTLLGEALRQALDPGDVTPFVARVLARAAEVRIASWDTVLARWARAGVAAAVLVALAA